MNYMLRKTIVPWKVDETISEVLEYCKTNHFGEVIWKIDVEEFNKGFVSLETVRQGAEWVKKAKEQFDPAGVITSINPWMTINHSDYGRDSRGEFPQMQWMVDYTGSQAKACACPLSPAFHEHLIESYKLYAQTRPEHLWIEDDFRHFNHTPAVTWGCFCPIHLGKFSDIMGKSISREELVNAILRPGVPHPWRAKWMDFLGQNMVDLAGKLEKAVHKISPDTKLALMLSEAEQHSVEGRKWHELLRALAGPHKPVSRPHMGPYINERFDDALVGAHSARQTVSCMPSDTVHCLEIDLGGVFTQFVRSARSLRQLVLRAPVMGYKDITLNLYDHVGTPLPMDDPFAMVLRDNKAMCDGLLEYCKPAGRQRGIGQIFMPDIARYVRTEQGKKFEELFPKGNQWGLFLESLGHGLTYKAEDTDVIALTGQTTRAMTDEQIKRILSKGVLLDASAAQVLTEQGYGEYIGVETVGPVSKLELPIAAEDFGNGVYNSPRHATRSRMLCEYKPLAGAEVESTFVDFNKSPLFPAMVLYENSLGGRVACFAIDLQNGFTPRLLGWKRKKQFEKIILWLGWGKLPLYVTGGTYPLPIRIDYNGYSVISIFNNSPDTWPEIEIKFDTVGRQVKEILMITQSGEWVPADYSKMRCEGGILEFTAKRELEFMDLAVFCIKF